MNPRQALGYSMFLVSVVCSSHARGGQVASAGRTDSQQLPDARARQVLEALWSSRQDLHSGVCRAAWKLTGSKMSQDGEFAIFFDFDQQRMRTDWTDRKRDRRTSIALTPQEKLLFVSGSHIVERMAPTADVRVPDVYLIDLRLVGLLGLGEMQTGAEWEQMRERLRDAGPPRVFDEGAGIFRIVWVIVKRLDGDDGPYDQTERRTTWVDSARSFVPTRLEDAFGFSAPGTQSQPEPYAVTETEWVSLDDALVPARSVFTLPKSSKVVEMAFTWEQVNGPVADGVFSVEGLPAPRPATVVDSRLGADFIERVIGQPRRGEPVGAPGRWRWIATGASIVVLVAIVVVFLLRPWRKSARST